MYRCGNEAQRHQVTAQGHTAWHIWDLTAGLPAPETWGLHPKAQPPPPLQGGTASMGWDSFSSAVCKVLHFTVKRRTLPTVPVGRDPGPGLVAADHSGHYALFSSLRPFAIRVFCPPIPWEPAATRAGLQCADSLGVSEEGLVVTGAFYHRHMYFYNIIRYPTSCTGLSVGPGWEVFGVRYSSAAFRKSQRTGRVAALPCGPSVPLLGGRGGELYF